MDNILWWKTSFDSDEITKKIDYDKTIILTINITIDETSPEISNIQIIDITENSATITWQTDEPSDSYIEYGKTENYKFNTYAETIQSKIECWGKRKIRGQLKDRWDDICFVTAGNIKTPEGIYKSNSGYKVHPCQMPRKLAERAIKFSTDEDDIVLDPFVGSGTTAKAAKGLNRRFIGIESNPKFAELAEWRINERTESEQLTF